MSFTVQHIRSGEFAKRPAPADLSTGQLAVNYNNDSPGLFFKTDSGALVKVGPTHVGASAPQQQNWTERSIGEMWLDTAVPETPVLRVWTASGWTAVGLGTTAGDGSGGTGTTTIISGPLTSDSIGTGAIITSKIAPAAVTTDKIADGAITTEKIADDAVTADKLSINGDIIPTDDNEFDLGSTTRRFSQVHAANVYTGDLHMKNERGDWTVIEEEDFLRIRNNKTGKSFRLMMEEI